MDFNLLGNEEYKKLLSIFMCNIEITPSSQLFTSGNYLKPYSDKAGSIAIGYGLDLKVNSISTITNLYKKIFGETWKLSDDEKDIITKLQNKELTTYQALEKFNSLLEYLGGKL